MRSQNSIKYVIFLTVKKEYENEMWEIAQGFQNCLCFYSSIKTKGIEVFYKIQGLSCLTGIDGKVLTQ